MKSLKARTLALAATLAVLLLACVGGTTAYLHSTSRLTNIFQLATVNVDVTEDFNGETKNTVAIQNPANTPVYIRATLIFAWKDAHGRILEDIPQKDVDYTLDPGAQTDWVKGGEDGYYYYQKSVPSGGSTSNLLDSLVKKTSPAGKTLSVTVVAQAVQATPAQAAHDLWGASVDAAGVLTPKGGVAP